MPLGDEQAQEHLWQSLAPRSEVGLGIIVSARVDWRGGGTCERDGLLAKIQIHVMVGRQPLFDRYGSPLRAQEVLTLALWWCCRAFLTVESEEMALRSAGPNKLSSSVAPPIKTSAPVRVR